MIDPNEEADYIREVDRKLLPWVLAIIACVAVGALAFLLLR